MTKRRLTTTVVPERGAHDDVRVSLRAAGGPPTSRKEAAFDGRGQPEPDQAHDDVRVSLKTAGGPPTTSRKKAAFGPATRVLAYVDGLNRCESIVSTLPQLKNR